MKKARVPLKGPRSSYLTFPPTPCSADRERGKAPSNSATTMCESSCWRVSRKLTRGSLLSANPRTIPTPKPPASHMLNGSARPSRTWPRARRPWSPTAASGCSSPLVSSGSGTPPEVKGLAEGLLFLTLWRKIYLGKLGTLKRQYRKIHLIQALSPQHILDSGHKLALDSVKK